ncbi:hypothetical protein HON49_05470, partial [archaeon]|nr:hypothetical protein [archaeon]
HISTGGSSVAAVNTVREVGGKVTECLAITTYEFVKANNLYFIHPFLNFNPKKSLY